LFLNQFLRENRNNIIWKLYEEGTIFISAFNAENLDFMTSWECYENKWFYMKYIGKYLSEERLLTRECTNVPARSVPITTNVVSSTRLWRGVLDTTLCDKVCQWLATRRWFSRVLRFPPVSSTNETDLHNITEILL
jgi:hypothetical protein